MHFKDAPESVQEHPSAPSQITLLSVGLNHPLEAASLPGLRVIDAETGEDANRLLAREEVAVLLIGPRLAPKLALNILDRYSEDVPGNVTATVILCIGSESDLFQTHVNDGRIFYMAHGDLTAEQLSLIAPSAAARFRARRHRIEDPLAARVGNIDELLDFCIRLPMQVDLPSAAGLLTATARALLNAELVQYLVYDAEEETLTPADALSNKEWSESAAAGLAAFVARTGERIRLDCIGHDLRCDLEADNPGGSEDARFLAEPLIGPKSLPLGVITVTRSGNSEPFSEEDALLLQLLADCAAPTFNQIALQGRVQALLLKRAEGAGSNSDVFREEALQHHIRSWDQQGEVLKTLPPWLRTTYWVMLVLVSVSLLGTVVVRVHTYASGPVVIRANRSMFVTAENAGRVQSIAVSAGDAVKMGDTLVVLDGEVQPSPLRGQTSTITALANGVVSDIRIRSGQMLDAGAQIMTIVEPDAGYDVIAFMPESNASRVRPGMSMRLRVDRGSTLDRTVQISRVGHEILNPIEAARYVGKEDDANFSIAGRVIAVRAALPSENPGGSLTYHDGVIGEAEVGVRSEPVIFALIPGLRKIFGKAD